MRCVAGTVNTEVCIMGMYSNMRYTVVSQEGKRFHSKHAVTELLFYLKVLYSTHLHKDLIQYIKLHFPKEYDEYSWELN